MPGGGRQAGEAAEDRPSPMSVSPHLFSGFTISSTFGFAAIPWKRSARGPRACFRKPAADQSGFVSLATPS